MACCILTAYIMNRIIKGLEILDLRLIQIQYNDFDNPDLSWETEPCSIRTLRVQIGGMTCATCVHSIEQALLKVNGVERVSVSLPFDRATVIYNEDMLSSADIVAAIIKAGYEAKAGEYTAEEALEVLNRSHQLTSLRSNFISAATISGVVATVESIGRWLPQKLDLEHGRKIFAVQILLACWVQLASARWIHSNAWKWILRGSSVNMDTLISLSLLLGVCLSFFNIYLDGWRESKTYFATGCFLTTVITAGRYLDVVLKKRSALNFSHLFRLQSETAQIQVLSNEGRQIPIPAYLLRRNEQIVVQPMSIIPCDCYVLEGSTVVDESTMTGESLPSTKVVGDFLMSGTRNLSNRVIAIVTAEQQDSSLQHLIDSISIATEKRSDQHGQLERMIAWFVTTILVLACFSACYSFSTSSGPSRYKFNIGAQRAMAVLAASCPCALGLAIPSATIAGIDAAWACGALLTGGERTLENLSSINHIVMDKTGTMTRGDLQVTSCHLVRGDLQEHCHRLLYLAERDAQSHPAGKAVFQWALQQLSTTEITRLVSAEVTEVTNALGRGVSCSVRELGEPGIKIHVGSMRFLEDAGISDIPSFKVEEGTNRAAIHFAFNNSYAGRLDLLEIIREEAPRVVRDLCMRGYEVTMLTGDTQESASIVAKTLEIPVLSARSLPHEKQAWIQSLRSQGHKIMMIGDGINDTLAQSTADVGVQFCHNQSLMTGAADVVVLSRSLETLPMLLDIASMAVSQSAWNIRWAIGYNVVTVSLAFGIFESWGLVIDASLAGTLMACSSLLILGLSLHLRRRLSYINSSK